MRVLEVDDAVAPPGRNPTGVGFPDDGLREEWEVLSRQGIPEVKRPTLILRKPTAVTWFLPVCAGFRIGKII